jgi:hypothetical protein
VAGRLTNPKKEITNIWLKLRNVKDGFGLEAYDCCKYGNDFLVWVIRDGEFLRS